MNVIILMQGEALLRPMMKQRSNRFVLQREMKNGKGWDKSMGTMPEYIAKYQIRGVIGHGGMAKVYRAYDSGLDREVALKVLNENYSGKSEEVERFLREARLSAKIKHPNVVPIYEVGSDGKGHNFIAMELIEGETLADKIRQKGCIEAGEAIEIVMVVCAALSEAHRHGVVHRDIKPINVMIDVRGHIYVMDFGIAKALNTMKTSVSDVIGTPMYMSPERCEGAPGDIRSDMYSLGIVLYEMLTGSPPFVGEPIPVTLKQIREEPEPPRSRNGQIPVWLNSVVMRLLAKEPGRRFQSCGELVEALREKITVPIPRPSMSPVSRKWLLIGLQGAAAVIVGVVVFAYYGKPVPYPDPLPPPVEESKQSQQQKTQKEVVVKYVCEGQAFEQADDNEKAKEAYSRALRLEPGNSEAREGSERCKGRLDKETKRINEEKARKEVASNYSEVVNGVEIEMVYVKGGEYEMGCGSWAGDCGDDEKGKDGGAHRVRVNDFYIGKYEVTVGQWRKFVEDNKGYQTEAEKEGKGVVLNSEGTAGEWRNGASWKNPGFLQNSDRHPVVMVSWNDAEAYRKWLSVKTGKEYRLPTEAEWEYAARSRGKEYRYSWGNGSPSGNIAGEEVKKQFPKRPWEIWAGYDDGNIYTAEVGKYRPNELGLCDMSGNVWEWCNDVYGSDYYKNSPDYNPQGPAYTSGSDRVIRGGSWDDEPGDVRAANRRSSPPSVRYGYVGFRLARTL